MFQLSGSSASAAVQVVVAVKLEDILMQAAEVGAERVRGRVSLLMLCHRRLT